MKFSVKKKENKMVLEREGKTKKPKTEKNYKNRKGAKGNRRGKTKKKVYLEESLVKVALSIMNRFIGS